MKYLRIHTIIIMTLVVIFTLTEFILVHAICMLRVLWDFKVPKNIWSSVQESDGMYWGSLPYRDKTLMDTLIRRYKFFFE